MTELIRKYRTKIENCDSALNKINMMIDESRNDTSINLDDLIEEMNYCMEKKLIYIQFVEDLEGVT